MSRCKKGSRKWKLSRRWYDVKRNYHCSTRIDAPFICASWRGVIFGEMGAFTFILPGFRSPVRSSCARCRRLLGLRILRGNVTATRKPGLWNADARFSDGKYVPCICSPLRDTPVESHGVRRKAAASDRNLLRHDEIKCSAKAQMGNGTRNPSHLWSVSRFYIRNDWSPPNDSPIF